MVPRVNGIQFKCSEDSYMYVLHVHIKSSINREYADILSDLIDIDLYSAKGDGVIMGDINGHTDHFNI